MSSMPRLYPSPGPFVFGEYVTNAGLSELSRFKYVAGPYTVLDRLLNPWWGRCASYAPQTLSPNAITLIGLINVFIASFIIIILRCGIGGYERGHFVFIVLAISIFIYQTLDAVDGKHARATAQSTPLGALFDHACDAIVATFGVLFLEWATSYPGGEVEEARTPAGLVALVLPLLSFYCSQLEHLYTNAMPAAGVTEAQFCGIFVMVCSFFVGPLGFHSDASSYLPAVAADVLRELVGNSAGVIPVKRLMHLGTTIFATVLCIGSLFRLLRRSTTESLKPLTPIAVLILLCCGLYSSETGIFLSERHLSLVAVGLVMADLNARMVISAVCKMNVPLLPLGQLLPFAFCSLASVPGCSVLKFLLGGSYKKFGPPLQALMLMFSCGWQIVSIWSLFSNTIWRACQRLGLPFLEAIEHQKGY